MCTGWLCWPADWALAPEVLLGCGGAEVWAAAGLAAAPPDGGAMVTGWSGVMVSREEGDNLVWAFSYVFLAAVRLPA